MSLAVAWVAQCWFCVGFCLDHHVLRSIFVLPFGWKAVFVLCCLRDGRIFRVFLVCDALNPPLTLPLTRLLLPIRIPHQVQVLLPAKA